MTCSTMVVWYFWKNGRMSGGRSAMARVMMYLCGSKPQADAGLGVTVTSSSTKETIDHRVRISHLLTFASAAVAFSGCARPTDPRRFVGGSRAYRASAFRGASADPRIADL